MNITDSIEALRGAISALEAHADYLETWLHFWVTLVAIGVIVEVTFVVWEHRENLHAYRRGTIRSPERPSKRKLLLELFGAALVAIGVSGELGVDIKAAGVQTDLRKRNGELVQLLQNASSIALRDAADANERATQNEIEAARLNKLAEDERTARVKIEESVAWRTIDDVRRKKVVSRLSRFAPQLAECTFLSSDMEAFSLSADIADSLRAAGWRVIPPSPWVINIKNTSLPTTVSRIERLETGVEIVSTPDAKSIDAANAIAEELHRLGFDAVYKATPQRKELVRVWVTVGHRPLGPQGEAKLRRMKH